MSTDKDLLKAQLGMPFETANHRLKKLLLFSLAQKLGQDACYRCGIIISFVEDFSVDHKEPWLYVSTSLFWDINNIAFSHLQCNRSATRKSGRYRKVDEAGLAWCSSCKQFKPNDRFHKDSSRWNNLMAYCKECKKEIRHRK